MDKHNLIYEQLIRKYSNVFDDQFYLVTISTHSFNSIGMQGILFEFDNYQFKGKYRHKILFNNKYRRRMERWIYFYIRSIMDLGHFNVKIK